MPERILMTADDMRRAVTRIAHEILEAHRGSKDIMLVGMRTRGVPLARRLSESIRQIEGDAVPVGTLDIGLYRDDLSKRGATVAIAPSEMPVSIEGRNVVLVDDVIETGRSIRAALDALMAFGRPQRIQLAVLIDRGRRELPIRPDYVGKNVPTARGDDVRVQLAEQDGRDEVVILPQEESP